MARLCERPGCSVPAAMSYGFDPDQLVVWLDRFDGLHDVRSGVLCLRHADAMVVPLGWMLDDRREPAPQLFRTPAVKPVAGAATVDEPGRRRRSERARGPEDDTEQLLLDAAFAEAVAAIPDDAAVPAPAAGLVPTALVAEPVHQPTAPAVPGHASTGSAPVDVASAVAMAVTAASVNAGSELVVSAAPALAPVAAHVDPVAAHADPARAEEPAAEDPTTRSGAPAWQPTFDPKDDLEGLLRPRGRLLSRAFRGLSEDPDRPSTGS